MSFTSSPVHVKHQHAKHHHHWEASNDYQYPTFNNENVYLLDPPKRNQVVEYEKAPVYVDQVGNNDKVSKETVDAEAEEFIKHEHKMFELSRWMSMRAG